MAILVGMQRRADATRQRLIDAAFEEIHRKGFQGASLDEILARTGVTKGALYHHFPSKKELGLAVIEEKLGTALTQVFLLPAQAADDPIEALVRTIRQAVRGLSEDGVGLGCPIANLAQEMSPVDEAFRERLGGLYQIWQDAIAKLLDRGRARGLVRTDVDTAAAAAFVVGALAGARVLTKAAKDRKVLERCVGQLVGYLESLRPAPAPRNRRRRTRV